MPMADQFWGDLAGAFADPEGYTWWIATRKEEFSKQEMEERAAEFFKQAQHAPNELNELNEPDEPRLVSIPHKR